MYHKSHIKHTCAIWSNPNFQEREIKCYTLFLELEQTMLIISESKGYHLDDLGNKVSQTQGM